MARLRQIVIDCRDAAGLAGFWNEVLDNFSIRPYDAAEIERLAVLGHTPETDPTVILDGSGLEICFQAVGVEPMTKRPLHLDVASDDRTTEVARLTQLGADVVAEFASHTSMRDPEGNDFCVTDAS